MNFRHAVATDTGLVRENNQDSHLAIQSKLYAVADGMGGHAAGEVASKMAVETLIDHAALTRLSEGALRAVFAAAHQTLLRKIQGSASRRYGGFRDGMGTTLTALAIAGDKAFVGHVGDSRCHLIRDGVGRQVTTDHTVAEALRAEGKDPHPRLEHCLGNCLGSSEPSHTKTDVIEVAIRPGDVFVLCTDGLPMSAEEIAYVVLAKRNPKVIADALVSYALGSGGHDNVTVVVIEVLP